MKNFLLAFVCIISGSLALAATPSPYTSTKETLQNITPQDEIKRLKEGNDRFVNNKPIQRDFLRQAKATSLKGQFPAATILSCMDSRGSPELIFDQGIGDVFSIRVAGNVVDKDQIGSMEYATKVIGSKVIVVMGHTQCGAIRGACEKVEMGNLTTLLKKIQPAVSKIRESSHEDIDCSNGQTIDEIAKQNVIDMIGDILTNSTIIHDQVINKQILVVGAFHDLRSGKIMFFDQEGNNL